MFFKEFYQKNPVAGTYSCSLVSMLICLLGRVLHWIHCGESWRGKMGCCCSGKTGLSHWQGDSITVNRKKCKKWELRVKQFQWDWHSPSGPSLYLTVDLAFTQGCSVILCLKAGRHFTRIIMFFVTTHWQLKADEVSLVTA